jgi:hypothetical protein
VILDDGADAVLDLVPPRSDVHYFREDSRTRSLGGKRNRACELASGEIILHWDDDDWYASWRIAYQVDFMLAGGYDLTGLIRPLFIDTRSRSAWEYPGRSESRWACGATLAYRRSLWEARPFPELNTGEDTQFVYNARKARIGLLPNNRWFVARIHGGNTSTRRGLNQWLPRDFESVMSMIGRDGDRFHSGSVGLGPNL